MYHPDENNYFDDKLSVYIEKVKVPTQDGLDLLGWYHEKDIKKNKTILFFHGNAGSLENRIHKLNHFRDMSVNFLIIAWRGLVVTRANHQSLGYMRMVKVQLNGW